MCGITGIIGHNAANYIEQFTDAIKHRGPDDFGIYQNEWLAFGHRRLSIQDLSTLGHQPMFSADGRYCIIFNGEIYNHKEIRSTLQQTYPFQSSGDTETLLYALIEYGESILNKLNGIFAFAFYDSLSGDILMVRDQFGIKPFYYYADDHTFLFSSELKSLLHYPALDKALSYEGLFNYIYFLYSPAEKTPFEHVKKLEPGHLIRLNAHQPGQFELVKYYEIPFIGIYHKKPEDEWVDLLEAQLLKAVECQMLADVPVGAFLSGGLDSSLMVAMAKNIAGHSFKQCFTIETDHHVDNEGFTQDLPYAKLAAAHIGVDLHIVKAEIDIQQDFGTMIWHLDEPQADPAPLNVWKICQDARAMDIVVLLSGAGADDLFSGYRRHQSLYYHQYIQWLPFVLRNLLSKMVDKMGYLTPAVRRLKKFLTLNKGVNVEAGMAELFAWLQLEEVKSLFSEEHKHIIKNYDPKSVLLNSLKNIPKETALLNKMLYWDTKYFLTDHNLNYTDKMSMAHGVEVRVPYLDKELVEFSTRIPVNLKMKGATTKYLLRKVGERYLPKEIIYRPKTGFGAPVREWITGPLHQNVLMHFTPEACKQRRIFDCTAVLDLIQRNKNGEIDASYSIWALLAITNWYGQFKR